MAVTPEVYRSAARLFASGVTIVTVAEGARLHGMTASSFAAVSLEPPLILVSLGDASRTRRMIRRAGVFGVNILRAEQRSIAEDFSVPGERVFDDIPHHVTSSGIPLLDGSLVAMSCRTTEIVRAGDHEVFIAEVLTAEQDPGAPLVYFDRSYRSII